MSAIFGVYRTNQLPLLKETLVAMQTRMNHWQADSMGIEAWGYGGLGHLSLHISEQSKTEQLPYRNEVAQLTITADARIDNRGELYDKLALSPLERTQTTDSQLILKTYQKWGKDCVQHLVGDFTFAIWDQAKEQLYCARDHIGIRPFCYYYADDNFIFASEKKGLFASGLVSQEIDREYFIDLVCYIFDHTSTQYKNVFRLPPAHYLVVSAAGLEIEQYWDLTSSQPVRYATDAAYQAAFRELLDEAINCRIQGDYPIGSMLSGGLDSSSVTALVQIEAQRKGVDVHTFSHVLTNEERGNVYPYKDEKKQIDEVVEYLGLGKNAHYITTEKVNFFDLINEAMRVQDGVQVTVVGQTSLAVRKAQEYGIKILFSGYLGDEMVTNRFNFYKKEVYNKLKIGQLWTEYRYGVPSTNTFQFCKRLLGYHYRRFKRQFESPDDGIYLAKKYLNQVRNKRIIEKSISYTIPQYFSQEKMILHSLTTLCLEEKSNAALAKRVKIVLPLGDKRLIEFYYGLPLDQKYRHGRGRHLFRFTVESLIPSSINQQYKLSGTFNVPSLISILLREAKEITPLLSNAADKIDFINFSPLLNQLDFFQGKKNQNRLNNSQIFTVTQIFYSYRDINITKYSNNSNNSNNSS